MSIQTKAIRKFINLFATEVSPEEFYRDVFPQGALADKALRESGKYAGIVYAEGHQSKFVNDDLETILVCDKTTSAQMNCVAYAGKGETPELARELYAFAFRVWLPDEVQPGYVSHCLNNLLFQYDYYGNAYSRHPRICPTYIVTENGFKTVYFYYVLSSPLPLYHGLHKQIQRLYDAISRAIHHLFDNFQSDPTTHKISYTYECPKPKPERFLALHTVVGTKCHGGICRAYRTGEKYDIDELNLLIPKPCQVTLYHPTMSLEEAKEKYPDWYRRRIEEHRKSSGNRYWKCSKKVYDWFVKLASDNLSTVQPGVLEALASYACKAQIAEHMFHHDLFRLSDQLKTRFPDDVIEEHEKRAKDFFDECPALLIKWSISAIEKWAGLTIKRNQRNGLTRKEHLKMLNAGKSRKADVRAWQKANPNGTQIACAKALGISRKTAAKWWKRAPKDPNPCPVCGTPMVKTKVGPWYWAQKGKQCARIDKECPNCHYTVKGKVYYLK